MLVAVFLSNLPESVAATTGLSAAGWPRARLCALWFAVVVVSALASLAGYALFDDASPDTIAFVLAFAGGAILTMLADTMMPEAFEQSGKLAGVCHDARLRTRVHDLDPRVGIGSRERENSDVADGAARGRDRRRLRRGRGRRRGRRRGRVVDRGRAVGALVGRRRRGLGRGGAERDVRGRTGCGVDGLQPLHRRVHDRR